MEYNIWKSVLLDWVNSTGFLVQNYENLGDTNIDTFFIAFKRQIKSTQIKSEDVVSFVRDYYKDFYLKLDDKNKIPVCEYVYFYSLFLHFACVLHADTAIQQICNNMVRKNQEVIEKFLDFLFKIGKCERAIVQNAIDEAENCDLPTSHVSPITRSLQSVLSNTSPQTPKSKMLNTWNLENRNLKAQLETERFERGYLEMQLNQCEKKLLKLDEDYKDAMTENNQLKKHIQSLDEDDHIAKSAQVDVAIKHLRREITEKEEELMKLTISYNEAKDDIELLKEQLAYADSQVKLLNTKMLESFSEVESFKNQLEEREKMINYINNNNKELSDMLRELQSNSKKQDFDSSSSYDLLNSTANDLNSSSFSIMEENLASAVVDIRLIDQQKQNIALNDSIGRLQSELSILRNEASKLYKMLTEPNEIEPTSPTSIFFIINKKYAELFESNKELTQNIESHCSEISLLKEQTINLQSAIDALNDKLLLGEKENENLLSQNQNTMVELENLKTNLTTCETQKSEISASLLDTTTQLEQIQSEKRELIAQHFDELRRIRTELEEKISTLNADLEIQTNEKKAIHTKLEQVTHELNESMDLLAKHKIEIDDISSKLSQEQATHAATKEEYATVQAKYTEISKKLEETQHDLNETRAKKEVISSELTERNELISMLKKNVEDSRKKMEGMQDVIASHTEEQNTLTNELKSAKEEITQKSSDIETLNIEIRSLNKREEKLKSEIGDLTQAQAVVKSEFEDLMQKHTFLRNEKQSIQDDFEKAQNEVVKQRKEFGTLTVQKTELEGKIAKLTEVNSQNESNCDLKSVQIDEISAKKSEFEENLKSTQIKLEVVTKSLQSTQSDLTTANAEKISLVSKVDQLNRSIDEITKQLVQEKEQFNEKEIDVTGKLSSIHKEKNALQEKLQEIEAKSTAQRKEFDELVKEREEFVNKIEQNSKDIEELQESLTKFQSENKILLDNTRQLEQIQTEKLELVADELSHIRTELEKKVVELDNLKTTLTTCETQKSEISASLLDTTTQLEQIQSEKRELIAQHFDELRRIRTELEEKISTSNADLEIQANEKKAIHTKLEQVSHELNESMDLLAKHKIEIDDISSELSQEQATHAATKEEYATVQAKCTEISQKLEETQQDLTQTCTKKEEFSSVLTERTERISGLKKELEDYEKKVEEMQNAIVSHVENENTLSNELKSAKEEIIQKSSDIETLIIEIRSLNDREEKLKSEIGDLTQAQAVVKSELVDLMQKHTLLRNEKQSIQDDFEKAQNEVVKQRKEFEILTVQKTRLEEKVAKLSETNLQNEKILSDFEIKSAKIDELTVEKSKLEENLKLTQIKLEEVTKSFESTQRDLSTVNTEKNSLVSKVIQLNRSIDELTQKMVQEKEQFNEAGAEATEKLRSIQEEKDALQEKLQKIEDEYTGQGKQFDELVKEKAEFVQNIEQYTKHIEELQESLTKIKSENNVLLESARNKEQLVALSEQIVRIEMEHNEKVELWKKEKESLIQDVKICRAKLMKEREAAEQKEKEYKAMRNGFEEKLEKMKEKMKTLYKEEMAKVQDKHEKQLNELISENRKYTDKLILYDERTKEFSSQIHALNEEKLMLLKEHEIMKSKLRTYEIGSTLNGANSTATASKFFEMRGGNFRMEDEEGELFDNTYLDELKRGSGRESLTLEEIQRRNSMVPPHLRSSYMPQFADNGQKKNETTFKSLDDSMFSTQSESRRGTAYKRPGPPTPSKNGGRLSLGIGDLSRGDVLREQNGHNERPSLGGGTTKPAKKNTPGKLSRIFSTTKLKDEGKENDNQVASRSTLHQLQKLFFSTSTPRHRNFRHSSLPKFETTSLFGSMNNSVSTIDSKLTADQKPLSGLSRNLFAHAKRLSQKLGQRSVDKKTTPLDSTPDNDESRRDSTKLATCRKAFIRKRSSLLKKKASRIKTQREKRFSAYNRIRRISKIDRNDTFSVGSAATYDITGRTSIDNITGATYDVVAAEITYESDILNFQAEVNECQGPVEIIVDSADDEVDFEKLCNAKQSECPYMVVNKGTAKASSSPPWAHEKTASKSVEHGDTYCNLSPQSVNSNFSSNSTTRMSSHCGRLYWNQQKIPKITTYKAEKKSFDNHSNNNSTHSQHSIQSSLMTTVKSFHTNVSIGWNDLPPFIKYYIISITICFVAILYFQFSQ